MKKIELKSGEKFGRWTVLEAAPSKNGCAMYRCECECGNIRDVSAKNLKYGKSLSCGCLAKEKLEEYNKNSILTKNDIDITGEIFGNIEVIRRISGRGVSTIWECNCLACGKIFNVVQSNLISGATTSCGCVHRKRQAKCVGEYVGQKDGTTISMLQKTNKIFSTNTTGVRGVSFSKQKGKYVAYIQFKGKLYNLGFFKKLEDAADARKEAEEEMYLPFLKEQEDERLSLLTEKQREVYLLYTEGMKQKDIAKKLGVSTQNVSAAIKIAKEKLDGKFVDKRGIKKSTDINKIKIPDVKEYNNKRVVTFKDIDIAHARAKGSSKKKFEKCRENFIENVDFYVEKQGDKEILLFTETGYLMLVNPLYSDFAFAAQRKMIIEYFNK